MAHPLSANPKILIQNIRWTILITPDAIHVGSLNAFFLWILSTATATSVDNPWLIYLLHLAGIVIVYCYRKLGKNSEVGKNLIMDEIHQPGSGIPTRMGQ
ncbi:voltage-gated chloride channel protein, partial [Photobacterium sanguinicancri]|nr:voltage-gated chloride channel protein [Photobacterium sanguinicancri]